MKDLLMSCNVECPPVSRDLLNRRVNGSSKRNQHGNWNSILEPNCSRGEVGVWAGLANGRDTNKEQESRAHLPPCCWGNRDVQLRLSCWYLPGRSICSDSNGLQPRCADKTVFPGERQTSCFCAFWGAGTETVKIMTQKRCWDTLLVCRNTQLNLKSFVSLDHSLHSLCKPWSFWRYLGVKRVGLLTKNNESLIQNSPLLLGPSEILSWALNHRYRISTAPTTQRRF